MSATRPGSIRRFSMLTRRSLLRPHRHWNCFGSARGIRPKSSPAGASQQLKVVCAGGHPGMIRKELRRHAASSPRRRIVTFHLAHVVRTARLVRAAPGGRLDVGRPASTGGRALRRTRGCYTFNALVAPVRPRRYVVPPAVHAIFVNGGCGGPVVAFCRDRGAGIDSFWFPPAASSATPAARAWETPPGWTTTAAATTEN